MGKKKHQSAKAKPAPPAAGAAPQPKAPLAGAKAAQTGSKAVEGGRTTLWMMVVLAVVVVLANIATLGYDYTLDDPFFTTENPNVSKGLSAIKEFFTHAAYYGVFQHHDASYRPLMLTSFALEKDLFGFDPHSGHLINLILFTLEIVVLFQLLRSMFREQSVYIPFFMTLLFALHPIHTEVIASIKSRDEIMALLFSALTLLQTLRYADTGKMSNMLLSGLFFFCALLSKETPISLLLIAPMTVFFFRDLPVNRIVRTMIPYVAVAAVYMLMRSQFIENDGEKVRILVNNNALMAAQTYGEKLATALFIQLKYMIILVFPYSLSYDYSYNQIPIIGFGDPKALAAVAVILGLAFYAITRFRKKDVFAYCILFYAMSVGITANIVVDIGATAAERFIFTGSLAFCIAAVLLIARLLKTDMRQLSPATGKPLFGILLAVSLLYGVKTIARNEAWRNNQSLYETGLETAPNSWRAQYLLGVEYTREMPKETDPARKKELYQKAIAGFTRSLEILPNNSDVYLLMGYAYEFGGQTDSARMAYENTLKLDSMNKQARLNLGNVYFKAGRLDDAIFHLSKVLAMDSLNTDALTTIGASYGNKGMLQQGLQYYLKAVRIRPEQPANVYMSMSNIYRYLGDSSNCQKYRQLMNKARAAGQ